MNGNAGKIRVYCRHKYLDSLLKKKQKEKKIPESHHISITVACWKELRNSLPLQGGKLLSIRVQIVTEIA